MRKYLLDGYHFTTRKDSYDYMKEIFGFPEFFGNNLDALWDLLSTLPYGIIEIRNARMIPKNLGEYGLKILDVLGDLNEIEDIRVVIYW